MALQTGQDNEVTTQVVGTRRVLRRIHLRSVLRFSVVFSITWGLVMLLAGGVVYFVLLRLGLVQSLQATIQRSGFPRFRLRAVSVLQILSVLVLVGAVAWTAVSVLAAFIFNLVSDAVGGIEVTLKD
jgi:hypothetical protein